MELTHGGDVAGYRIRYGRAPLDFSASLNPLGMPPAVRDAAREAVDASIPYPDPFCRDLVAAIARHLDVPESGVFCGNGAADIIYRLTEAVRPRIALVTAPTFAEYELALQRGGCATERHHLDRNSGFELEDDILRKISSELDIIFLCQPNNPTGRLISPELMSAILERCRAAGTLLVVDECFRHFVDDPEKYSLVRDLDANPNLFILDSFTKLYGMAGIRLGFGLSSNESLIERLSDAGAPWAVSTVAQAAGAAALRETDFVERSRHTVRQAKRDLVDGLGKLGMEVIGDAANYVFFRAAVADLDEKLAQEGIMIRNCANFRGLEPGYYRVAVRLDAENRVLLQAMAAVLKAAS